MKRFVHLHCHSEYSLLDGAIKVEELVKKASSLSMPALALTDHGNLFGAIKFYNSAISLGIKPILGCEVYIAEDRAKKEQTETLFHSTLLVKDITGYKNLMKLVSFGYLEGFYRKPRIDKELLAEYHNGLILLSGCIKGEIPQLILNGQIETAKERIAWFCKVFGEENFYFELLNHHIEDEEKVNPVLIQLSKEMGIGLVATNDIHYLKKEDAGSHDILLCIQTQKTVDDKKRLRFSSDEFYFRTEEEMRELFSDLPEAIANTAEIADRCNLELEFGTLHLPHYRTEDDDLDGTLRRLCMEGLENRYGENKEARERLEYELSVICKMRYSGYFLIVWDLVNYAHKRGIPVGPGRGSVAGSIVAYCLGITDIDPLKYDLLFERFLSTERISMPDIDIDFCYKRRDEVIEYVAEKYGKDRVAQIITFGTMKALAVIRDVGRALNLSYSECDRLAKMVAKEPHITLTEALIRIPEFAQEYRENRESRHLIDVAKRLEGLIRHASTHAAGIVIGNVPLIEILPLYKDPNEKKVATQYAKDSIEEIGLLKMDFLGLKNLTVINDTVSLIKERRGEEIDTRRIPLDDKKTYQLLARGASFGLFQLESGGMQELLRRLKPTTFTDLIALVALHRPGPLRSGMVTDFIEAKNNKKRIEYLHPALAPILAQTYGVIVYQEQVMQIAEALAGFSMAQADELRRAMSKKQEEKMRKMRDAFITGCGKNGVKEQVASKIYDLMAKFAEYGFNKSHSAAYALIAYQTAYLKANYPLEFMASLLTNELGDSEKITLYIAEAERMGVKVTPPDINSSTSAFAIDSFDNIRFSLKAIKHVGVSAINSIVSARRNRPFSSIFDFVDRVDLRVVNKRVIESLIKAGAFDSLHPIRSQLLVILDELLERRSAKKKRDTAQETLFEIAREEVKLPDIPEWSETERLRLEKEMMGVYVSGHPLDRFECKIARYSNTQQIKERPDGARIMFAGMITSIKRHSTRENRPMAFLRIEDKEGSCEVVLFPEPYQRCEKRIRKEQIVVVKGEVRRKEGEPKVLADSVLLIDEAETAASALHLRLSFEEKEEKLYEIRSLIERFSGSSPFYIHFGEDGAEKVISVSPKLRVNITEELLSSMEKITEKGAVWLT
jgi:DNA polymerase-3 subunit alpha